MGVLWDKKGKGGAMLTP